MVDRISTPDGVSDFRETLRKQVVDEQQSRALIASYPELAAGMHDRLRAGMTFLPGGGDDALPAGALEIPGFPDGGRFGPPGLGGEPGALVPAELSGLTLGVRKGNGQTFEQEISDPAARQNISTLMKIGGDENHEAVARTLAGVIGDDYAAGDEIRNVSVVDLGNGDYRIDFQHVHSDFDVTGPVTYTDDYSVDLDFDYDLIVPEGSPSAPTLSGTTVTENDRGTVIGVLSSTDPDGGPITYAVNDERFEVDEGRLKLKDGVSLDHETTPTVSVNVTATDQTGLWNAQDFTITVTDVALEPPAPPTLSASTVAENAPGAVIGTVSSQDDNGDPLTYSVNDARFEVVGDQLKLKDGVQLDHETEPTVRLTVTADDGTGYIGWSVFDISVTDVAEDAAAGSTYTATVTDDEGAQVLELEVGPASAYDAAGQAAAQIAETRYEPEGTITANDQFIEYRLDAEVQSVEDNGDGTYAVTITQQFGREYRNAGGAQSYSTTDTYTISLTENESTRQLEAVDIDGVAAPGSSFDLAAERTFDLGMRVLDATDGVIPSDWTDVEYTALTFTLMGRADLVGGEAWDGFVSTNFEDGLYNGGTPDLSMFGELSEADVAKLNLGTIEAAIVSGTIRALPEGTSQLDADTWEGAFQSFLMPSGEGGRRLNVWEAEWSEFWESFTDVVVPGSGEGASTGATSYAYGLAPTAATGAGEVGLGAALGTAGLVVGAELLIAYVAVQSFRTIQHEYTIPVYGTRPTAEVQDLLRDKLDAALLAITPEGGYDEAWAADRAGEVGQLLDAGDVGGAIEVMRDIESTDGARAVALVFTALDPQQAQQLGAGVVEQMGSSGRIRPSGMYVDVAVAEGAYSALEDLAFGTDASLLSVGEGIARKDGALTAMNVETIDDTAGGDAIADILSVLTVQETANPGTSNIDGFIGLTTRLASGGTDILNRGARYMAGRRDGSSEALLAVLTSEYPDLPAQAIFRDANTAATADYYERNFGTDGAGIVAKGHDATFEAYAGLETDADRAAYLATLAPDRQLKLLESLSAEDAAPVLGAMVAADGGIDNMVGLLNAADPDTAAGMLVALAVSNPEATGEILTAAATDPEANAGLLEAAASVSTYVLGVIPPADFVNVVETLATSGPEGADLATRMLNGFSNQEIAAVLTLFEDPAARDAIFASDARRGNFLEPGEMDAELGLVDEDTQAYADTLIAQVESGELTPEEAGQLFYLYQLGIQPTTEQGARRQAEATPEWAAEQMENLTQGDVPSGAPTELTDADVQFAQTVGDEVVAGTDDLMAEHGDELQQFAAEAEVGETLDLGGYTVSMGEANLIQVQMRVRYNNIPADAADPANPGGGTGKALFVWVQFDRNQLVDGSVGEGDFDFSVIVRPHAYAGQDINLPLGLKLTGFIEAGGELELAFSTRAGEDGGRINRLDEIKVGAYSVPGVVVSDVLRFLPKAASRVVANLWSGGDVAQRTEVLTNVGMMALGMLAGPQQGLPPQARNLLVGEAVRGLLSILPYATQTTSALAPAEVSALGEAMVAGLEAAYNYFNPAQQLQIEASIDGDALSDAASMGSSEPEEIPEEDIEVQVTSTPLLPDGFGDNDAEGDIEMVPLGADRERRAEAILAGGANLRGEMVDLTDPPAAGQTPPYGLLPTIPEGDEESSEGTPGEAGNEGFLSRVGSYYTSAVESIAQSFESRTLALFYFNGFAHFVNNDIVPGREPDEFRGGWNGDSRLDYFSGTAAFVTVSESEFTFKDRSTDQGWQLGVPRLDFVDPRVWGVQKPISEEGRLVLNERAQDNEDAGIHNPPELPDSDPDMP